MAIRVGTSNSAYAQRTTDLPSLSAFTWCGWAKGPAGGSGEYKYWGISSSGGSSYLLLGWSSTLFGLSTSNGSQELTAGNSPASNAWFFWVMQNESGVGSSAKIWRLGTDTAFQSLSAGTLSFTPASMELGSYNSGTEGVDKAYGNVKVWTAVLTEAELAREMWSARPLRTTNLHIWSPFFKDATDYSGNARNWTVGGGTATYEDGPPISWGGQPLVTSAISPNGDVAGIVGASSAEAFAPNVLAYNPGSIMSTIEL